MNPLEKAQNRTAVQREHALFSERLCDIECHLEMLLDDDLKKFCGYREEDDLPMRIFRVLGGYRAAYDRAMQLQRTPASANPPAAGATR